jgi:hypothetical protein
MGYHFHLVVGYIGKSVNGEINIGIDSKAREKQREK